MSTYTVSEMGDINVVSGMIVDAAYRVHSRLGPGLLESVYEAVFARMLEKRGLHVERQVPVALEYDGIRYEAAHRVDLLVENQVVVEVKAVDTTIPVHSRQVLTYLRLLDLRVGLLINFGAEKLHDGLRRILNPHASPKTNQA